MQFETQSRSEDLTSVPSLPKGGGAIRSIGESFKANPATGTATLSVPLPFSKARALSPDHALSYDSGAGNGPFGVGWSIGLPSVSRKTERALPTYDDLQDTFSLSGAELLPMLDAGEPVERTAQEGGRFYTVRRYVPRMEGSFDRIELWRDRNNGITHWRTWSSSNVISVYGQSQDSRLGDPNDPARVFSWHLERVFDGAGNITLYTYKREDDQGIEAGDPHDGPRLGQPQAQLYPHEIFYGNRTPFAGDIPPDEDFCFSTRFDYGLTASLSGGEDASSWALRADAFSRFRSGFEIRTRRLCHRVLTRHRFAEIGPQPETVAALELRYDQTATVQAQLVEVQMAGFTRASQDMDYQIETLPGLRFSYTEATLGTKLRKVMDTAGEPLFADGTGQERWVDLEGNALPGLLSESPGGLIYRDNLGGGVLGEAHPVALAPTLVGLDDALQVEDRQGRGAKQFVARTSNLAGLYQTGHADLPGSIAPFKPVRGTLSASDRDGTMWAIDLTGDGLADRLWTDGTHLHWYRAAEDGGFDEAQRVTMAADAPCAPSFVVSDASGLTFLADMSGDGLVDVVRVTRRGVRYWPNLGYGRFGPCIEMAAPPELSDDATLNPDHVRLADVNGNGLSDILLLGAGCVTLWENQSGNSFGPPQRLEGVLPDTVSASAVAVSDVLGQGTACLSWTGQASGLAQGQRLYVDLYEGVKAGLLERVENGFGGMTELSYRPSSTYAREAARAGLPWATRLHFPVHCLASTRITDAVTGHVFTSSYAYHHGYYDPDDREFRGFARVDQYDSESIVETGEGDTPRAFFQPTSLKKTWFHTGARLGNRPLEEALAAEFYSHDRLPLAGLLPELTADLSDADWAEAQRALKGTALRSETYTLDDSAQAEHPYSINFGQVRLILRQPCAKIGAREVPPVFQSLQRQGVSIALDRNPDDPRVSQEVTLEWNDWGMPLRGVTVSHGRWGATDADTPAAVEALQKAPMAAYAEQSLTDWQEPTGVIPSVLLNGPRRAAPTSFAAQGWEVRGLSLVPWSLAEVTALESQITAMPELAHADHDSAAGRRLVSSTRSYFAGADLSEPLPLGQVGPTGIVHHSEILAFTNEMLDAFYSGRVTDEDLVQAGYVRDGASDWWWVPSGTAVFDADPAERFYLPIGSRDPFGAKSHVTFDAHFLLIREARDEVGNTTRMVHDYRSLTPVLSQDANLNWTAVTLNALGQPLAMATMGKVAGAATPTGWELCEGSNLERPSARFAYDLTAWEEGRGPARATTTTYTDHGARTTGARKSLVSYEYTDGLGNLVMTKVQQAPGPAQRLDELGQLEEIDTAAQSPPALRWLANGRVVLNNKGQPLRQYEPYFSVTPDFDDAAALVEQGISAFMFYDAAGRGIGQLSPDGSWEKTRHTPWRAESWDAADTCLLDPRSDAELGAHFEGLPPALYAQSWTARRQGDARGPEAARAADVSAEHAATPAITHLDAGGRPALMVADNGTYGTVQTRSKLDSEGNALKVFDDLDRAVVTSRFDMLPPPDGESPKPALWQSSVDQGETAVFFDCLGRPKLSWDAHGRVQKVFYDALGRPTESWKEQAGGELHRVAVSIFGEDAPEATTNNLRGAPWQSYDNAGWAQTGAYDFLGNILHGQRQLLEESPGTATNWPDRGEDRQALLSDEVFRSEIDYDALGRPTRTVSPYADDAPRTVEYPQYDEGGNLAGIDAEIAGGSRKRYVEEITYDAKGQRQSIRLGNGVETQYDYDPESYRLTRLKSVNAAGTVLQDLSYTYDILGNVVAIRDATQPVIHYAGQAVEPVARFTYDALSRLTEATGREHIAQTGAPGWQTGLTASVGVSDLTQMRNYTQFYAYDSSGNILSMRHVAQDNSWTRHYGYDPQSHRLEWTNIGQDRPEGGDRFEYNSAGSMTSLPHLGAFVLNNAEQMVEVDLGGGGRAQYTYEGGGGRVRKRIERAGGAVEERLYLGGLEIYRKWVGGQLRLRRETVHISDDASAIAMVETQTHDDTGEIARPDRVARYQLSNHLGSATLEVDDAGELLTREEYHPYGTTAFFAAAAGRALPPKRYRYTGQERDEETGLQHHGARYYAPWLARWTSADPIGIGDGLNVYAYVGGNPVMAADPSGTTGEPNRDDVASAFMGLADSDPEVWRGITEEEAYLWADAFMNQDDPNAWYALTDHFNWSFHGYNGSFSTMQYRLALSRAGASFAAYSQGSYLESGANATLATTAWVGYHTVIGDTYASTAMWTTLELLGGSIMRGFATVGKGVASAGKGVATKVASPIVNAIENAPEIGKVADDVAAAVPDMPSLIDNPFPADFVESSSEVVHRIFFRNMDEVLETIDPRTIANTPGLDKLTTIADNPDLLRLWEQAIETKMNNHMFARGSGLVNGGTGNKVGEFLFALADGAPIDKNLGKAAYSQVRTEFGRLVKAEFPDLVLGEIDHFINKAHFPAYAIDPRWLIPTGSRAVHEVLHIIRSNGARNYWSRLQNRFKPASKVPISK